MPPGNELLTCAQRSTARADPTTLLPLTAPLLHPEAPKTPKEEVAPETGGGGRPQGSPAPGGSAGARRAPGPPLFVSPALPCRPPGPAAGGSLPRAPPALGHPRLPPPRALPAAPAAGRRAARSPPAPPPQRPGPRELRPPHVPGAAPTPPGRRAAPAAPPGPAARSPHSPGPAAPPAPGSGSALTAPGEGAGARQVPRGQPAPGTAPGAPGRAAVPGGRGSAEPQPRKLAVQGRTPRRSPPPLGTQRGANLQPHRLTLPCAFMATMSENQQHPTAKVGWVPSSPSSHSCAGAVPPAELSPSPIQLWCTDLGEPGCLHPCHPCPTSPWIRGIRAAWRVLLTAR